MLNILRPAGLACLLTAVMGAQAPAARQFQLEALDPAFHRLVAKDARLDKIAGGFGFLEGPVWDRRGFLYVSDEREYKIFKVFPAGKVETLASVKDPDGATLDAAGRLINAASGLRQVIAVHDDGSYKVLADRYQGKKFSSPNDVTLGPDGALYFTDPTIDLPRGEQQELDVKGIYRLANDGALTLVVSDRNQPNGLTFSPDGKRLYVTDHSDIHVYDVTKSGEIQNGRLFGSEPGPPRGGVPDGVKTDRKGNVWVTGPQGIWVWSAQGKHLGTIVLPENAANLNWGGADGKTLYIAATTTVYSIRTKVRGFVPGRR